MVLIGHGMRRKCCGRFARCWVKPRARARLVIYCQTNSVSAAHAFRIVLHTVPRVGRSHGRFSGGFYLHLLHTVCNLSQVVFELDSLRSGNRRCPKSKSDQKVCCVHLPSQRWVENVLGHDELKRSCLSNCRNRLPAQVCSIGHTCTGGCICT